jgi:hypothetical protein
LVSWRPFNFLNNNEMTKMNEGELGKIPGIREIGMTTNGVVLSRMLPDLIGAGLTHLNSLAFTQFQYSVIFYSFIGHPECGQIYSSLLLCCQRKS